MKQAKAGDRRIEYVELDALKPAKRNSKRHDLGAMHQSVGRFGFVETPVLDERTGRLVAGHGRLETLEQMRAADPSSPPEGVKLGKGGAWMVPVLRGWSSTNDHAAEGYLIASNRIGPLGGEDEQELATMLAELAQAGELAGVGYDGDDVDALLKRLADEELRAGGREVDEGIADDVKMTKCPKCGEEFPA